MTCDSKINLYVCNFDILDMKEPRFDFIHPPPYHPKQKWYPHKQPFNLYVFQIFLLVHIVIAIIFHMHSA